MDIEEKKGKIKSFLNEHKFSYVELNEIEINQVYNFYFNNLKEDYVSHNVLLYYGSFYRIQKNFNKMIKYYLLSAENGNELINHIKIDMNHFSEFRKNKKIKIKQLKNKINELENYIVELECMPGSREYNKAKIHFESLIN